MSVLCFRLLWFSWAEGRKRREGSYRVPRWDSLKWQIFFNPLSRLITGHNLLGIHGLIKGIDFPHGVAHFSYCCCIVQLWPFSVSNIGNPGLTDCIIILELIHSLNVVDEILWLHLCTQANMMCTLVLPLSDLLSALWSPIVLFFPIPYCICKNANWALETFQ